jgi:hypothetical protein
MWITNNSLNLQGAVGSETQSPMESGQNHALRCDLRQKILSFLNGHSSFGASAAVCAVAESSRPFKSLLLQLGQNK